MENMSKALKRVIDFYGFDVDQVVDMVFVHSGRGTVSFRRINNTYYKVYSDRRRIVHVNTLIAMLEEL